MIENIIESRYIGICLIICKLSIAIWDFWKLSVIFSHYWYQKLLLCWFQLQFGRCSWSASQLQIAPIACSADKKPLTLDWQCWPGLGKGLDQRVQVAVHLVYILIRIGFKSGSAFGLYPDWNLAREVFTTSLCNRWRCFKLENRSSSQKKTPIQHLQRYLTSAPG